MKKLKGFYQNNRIYCILMIVSIVCIILIASAFVYYFIEQTRTDVYGKRLYGIESVKISDDKQKEIEEKEFYDINFIFTNTAEDDNAKFFPLMGYKKSDATLISWIKQSERK